jgi:hypothetical protein
MAKIQIVVIDVAAPTFVKTAKGGYNFVEVAYKKDGKVEGKKLMDFANKELFSFVKNNLKPGVTADVSLEKNEKSGYWDWVGVEVVEAVAANAPTEAATPASKPVPAESKAVGRVSTSTYETPEERALRRAFEERKQVLIVRQSSFSNALAVLELNKAKFTLDDVLDTAQLIVDWVYEKDTPEQAIRGMSDDIPF